MFANGAMDRLASGGMKAGRDPTGATHSRFMDVATAVCSAWLLASSACAWLLVFGS